MISEKLRTFIYKLYDYCVIEDLLVVYNVVIARKRYREEVKNNEKKKCRMKYHEERVFKIISDLLSAREMI